MSDNRETDTPFTYPESAFEADYAAFRNVLAIATTDTFTLGDGDNWACRITWGEGWHVEVNQGVPWDAAAKHFWNAVAKMVGQAPPFGW
jgi:hypothetical protein